MPEVKRQTAYKCSIKQILEGSYIQRPGWDPNFIQLGSMQISRVNLMAVVVSKDGNSTIIDDGTGQIQATSFGEQKFTDFDIGDIVMIIGRPREYNQKRFVAPEIIRKIEDSRWVEYRQKELEFQRAEFPETETVAEKKELKKEREEEKTRETPPTISFDDEIVENNYASIILSTIKKLDSGDGANIQDVIKQSKLEKADKFIMDLLNEGEIFEIRAGRLKILE
jgi:RPA family protein